MRKIYARLVLWLIRPALELRAGADRIVITQQVRTAQGEAITDVLAALNRRGRSFQQVPAKDPQ